MVTRLPTAPFARGGDRAAPIDVREFADARQLAALTTTELVAVLARIAADRLRLDAVEGGILTELTQRTATATPSATAPLLLAKEAAQRLGVSVGYVRDHGARLGIAVPLGDGVTRYDPGAV